MIFKEELESRVALFKNDLPQYLPGELGEAKTLYEAMNYSINAGGKRLRPILMMEGCRIFGKGMKKAVPFAAALEMIHTYSLVHDDLPAMDNDDLRRGKPTTHRQFGEAMGILAGDGLLNLAYETMTDAILALPERDMVCGIRAMSIIAHSAGCYGMIGGQCADVLSEKGQVLMTERRLEYINHNKTGALIAAALTAGAALAGANESFEGELRKAGMALGEAFQIRDDILDVTGDEESLGKPIGSDARNEKVNFISLHGMEEANRRVEERTNSALTILRELPVDTEFLELLFDKLISRER